MGEQLLDCKHLLELKDLELEEGGLGGASNVDLEELLLDHEVLLQLEAFSPPISPSPPSALELEMD